ncbi:hypothetical protein LCGC14_0326110 [marine sediment metagenome]|uniref:Uncharacterized protein n=1 Tax=marine sediment metagenome TaxID=412755 RepID=A0A0F9THY1_9ZZZZ
MNLPHRIRACNGDPKYWKGAISVLADEAAEEITRLEAEVNGMTKARDRFCSNINQIGRMFWGEDKDHYAPDAVIRKVEQLQAIVDELPSEKQYEQLKGIAALAMDWRAAEVHHAACKLGIRHDGKSRPSVENRISVLRSAVDSYKRSIREAADEAKEEGCVSVNQGIVPPAE